MGFQGFGNIGDEAILTGIEAALRGLDGRVVTVFSGPRPEEVAAFPDAQRLVTARHLPTLSAFRALRRVDLLLLAGGGIFNDHWTGVVPRYAAWVVAARLAGARVAWIGVGVGPLRRWWTRALARLAARVSTLVLVRDPGSAALLGAAGHPQVVPDPALFNPLRPAPSATSATSQVGFILRAPATGDRARQAALVEGISDAIASAAARELDPIILTMGAEVDAPFVEEVHASLARRELAGVRTESLGPTPAAALDRIGGLDGLISVRLHGLLLGAMAGVPTVPIAYDEKVRAAADLLAIGDLVVPLADVGRVDLLAHLEEAGSVVRRDALQERIVELRSRSADVGAMIVTIGGRM
ncbi:MAG: polysaccharide pyruvyl transferase family protein [Candidatus Limnocylindria bacterium]